MARPLEEKVKKQWLWRVELSPEFAEKYGRDGWAVWKKYNNELTLTELGMLFDMDPQSISRWKRQYRLTTGGVH